MIDRMHEVESRCRRLSSSNGCSRVSGVRSSWAALATKRFCASYALCRRSSSPSTVSARFRSSSRGPREGESLVDVAGGDPLDGGVHRRSGRNILPATSQPSTNEKTDVRLARGRAGDGVQARRSRPSPVACSERAPSRRPRPRRSPLRQGPPGRNDPTNQETRLKQRDTERREDLAPRSSPLAKQLAVQRTGRGLGLEAKLLNEHGAQTFVPPADWAGLLSTEIRFGGSLVQTDEVVSRDRLGGGARL
jgi:hypothetical protein